VPDSGPCGASGAAPGKTAQLLANQHDFWQTVRQNGAAPGKWHGSWQNGTTPGKTARLQASRSRYQAPLAERRTNLSECHIPGWMVV